jgi:hypothetical protein
MPLLLASAIFTSVGSFSRACYRENLPEDLNGDNKVDLYDILIVATAFGYHEPQENWNPKADLTLDGIIDIFDIVIIAIRFGEYANVRHLAAVRINPRTLNLKSHGNWVTLHITFLKNCSVSEIDVSTLRLNETVCAEPKPVTIENNTLVVKLSRATIQSLILDTTLNTKFSEVSLTVSGSLKDGTQFAASDPIVAILHMPLS